MVKVTLLPETAGSMPEDVGRILIARILETAVTVTVTGAETSKYANDTGPPCKTGAV